MTTPNAPGTPPAAPAGGTPPVPPAAPIIPPGTAVPPAAPAPVEFKVPEGLKVDAKVLESFKATTAELKLDAAGGQKVLDIFLGQQKAALEADEQHFTQQTAKWVEEINKDGELGGANLAASRTAATKAVAKFGGEPLAALLKATGLDNNPALFRAFAKIGKAMGEDTIGGTGTPPPPAKKRDLQSALYPPAAP